MAVADQRGHAALRAFIGSATEVRARLRRYRSQRFIAMPVPSGTQHQQATAQTFETLIPYIDSKLEARHREILESLVDMLLPTLAEPDSTHREAKMIAKARSVVLRDAEWLSAVDIVKLANFSSINPNPQPSRWNCLGKIFSIKPNGSIELFPQVWAGP